jgi:hypothetical protein
MLLALLSTGMLVVRLLGMVPRGEIEPPTRGFFCGSSAICFYSLGSGVMLDRECRSELL